MCDMDRLIWLVIFPLVWDFYWRLFSRSQANGKISRYGLHIVAFVLMQANKKSGFTVTWSKYPTIKNASDPQKQMLQTAGLKQKNICMR